MRRFIRKPVAWSYFANGDAALSMGQLVVAIHVLPHIRKYLTFRLAQGERLADPATQDLIEHMTRILAKRVMHVAPEAQARTGAKSLLHLVCTSTDGPVVAGRRVKKLNAMLEELYRQHSHLWMDWLRETTGAPVNTALDTWRSRYGIQDEDQAFSTARIAYARHRQKQGTMLPHGGSRPGPRYQQHYPA